MTRNDLKNQYHYLTDDTNFADSNSKRARGRKFERLLHDLLAYEGLLPKTGFRPKGEEIDGSFVHHNHVFLLEAKWHNSPMPASSIYQFKGKVDGKLIGTIGIYFSMSGFSSEAVDALTFGKSVNILLFDRQDLAICIKEDDGFKKALDIKLRVATEKGTPYHSLRAISLKSHAVGQQSTVAVTSTNELEEQEAGLGNEDIAILVEGRTDEFIISLFLQKILESQGLQKKIRIFVSGGKYSIARHANAIADFSQGRRNYILVVDGDDDSTETRDLIIKNLDLDDNPYTVVIPEPEIESWFKEFGILDRNKLREHTFKKGKKDFQAIVDLVQSINIDSLLKSDKSFREFYNAIVESKSVHDKETDI